VPGGSDIEAFPDFDPEKQYPVRTFELLHGF
jgi:hypothetical protein